MGLTWGRQETDMRSSTSYDDTIAPSEANFETNPTHLEQDLNNLRSGLKSLLGTTNWFDTATRNVETINTALVAIEEKPIICGIEILTNVSVGGSDNWAVLSVAGSEAPSLVAAIGAVTTEGAVTALLPGASGTHSLNEVAGSSPIRPLNLVKVRDATTKDAIISGGQEIFGLLQIESAALDGDAFNDTDKQGQISFVIQSGDDLIACPAVDIQGKDIEYMYPARYDFGNLPENCTWPFHFSDQTASVDVTRAAAYSNQGTAVVAVAANATADLSAGIAWELGDAASAALFTLTEGSGGGTTNLTVGSDVDTYVNDAQDIDFDQGASFATGKTRPIDIGENDGLVESTAGDLEVKAAGELILNDTNMVSEGTWAGPGVKVSDTTAEVTAYEAAFGGEVSIFNALVQANASSIVRTVVYSVATANVNADTDVSGPSGDNNFDTDFGALDGGTFTADYDFDLNGRDQRPGANAAANHDVYPGTSLAGAGAQLKFEKKIFTGDQLKITKYV